MRRGNLAAAPLPVNSVPAYRPPAMDDPALLPALTRIAEALERLAPPPAARAAT